MFDMDLNKRRYIDIEHEVHNTLNTENQPCNNDPKYSKDVCANQQLEKESIKRFGCTTPFGLNKDNICTNETLSKLATKLYRCDFTNYFRFK